MGQQIKFLHRFQSDISQITKPKRFTYPFYYTPHELSKIAVAQVQQYIESQTDFEHNFGLDPNQTGLVIGKMFGVMVVEDQIGQLCFLAAVSGKLGNSNQHHYFIPPIYDMLDSNGFFVQEEEKINQLNTEIKALESSAERESLKNQLIDTEKLAHETLAETRRLHKHNKLERKEKRLQLAHLDEQSKSDIFDDLIKQSYRDQYEYSRLKKSLQGQIDRSKQDLDRIERRISELKEQRKKSSAQLQQKLFDQYNFLNSIGSSKNVLDIFREINQMIPPAGAGECAAPKLFQFAYQHGLKPICMAEFWWGASPASEIRKHKNYYPACRGKCEPILTHMMSGLEVEANPIQAHSPANVEIPIIYEDNDIIVVDKPTEFLSVPGIHTKDSVYTRILKSHPTIEGPVIIHRLDMSTSGILVLAKNKKAHQFIQKQFIEHSIEKRYTAMLEGILHTESGIIDLPLRVDLEDRPRQVVCYEYGKNALTKYHRIAHTPEGKTKVHFYPLTGRTHQLRVHAAHHSGLDMPIIGDDLYGQKAERLHLHAGSITFIHPTSKDIVHFEIEDPF